jgi:hypothetical protein
MYVVMLKHVTAMKIQVFWDLTLTDFVGETPQCSEGT